MATNNAINTGKPIEVSNGGTGDTSLTNHSVLLGQGTSAISAIIGSTGETIMGSTGIDPVFTSSPSFGGSVTCGTGLTVTTGDAVITSGNIIMPVATGSSVGSIKIGSDIFINAYGAGGSLDSNTFIGISGAANAFPAGAFENTAIGWASMPLIDSASGCVAVGSNSGGNIVSNIRCTFVGANSGFASTANSCTAIGFSSLGDNVSGADNTCVGSLALRLTTGDSNTALGTAAGSTGIAQVRNIFIGSSAGTNFTGSEADNIIIGSLGTSSDSHTVRIGRQGSGSNQQNKCFIAGITGVTVTGAAVLCSTTGQLGTISSSIRFKENVREIGELSSKLLDLNPVLFNFIVDKSESYGLIAEEVQKIMPELVIMDQDNVPYSLKYHEMPALLINELKKLKKELNELKAEIKTLKGE